MSFIAVAIIAGTAIGAYAKIEAGKQAERDAKAQQVLANRNALIAEQQAKAALERAKEEAKQFEKEGEALLGEQQVALAKGGVLTTIGTPAILIEETEKELEADKLAILKEGFLAESFGLSQAENLRFEGRIARARGKAAKSGSRLAAAGSILSGLGTAAAISPSRIGSGTRTNTIPNIRDIPGRSPA